MAGSHAAVAADVEVPADFGGDHAYVLALRLGAFAGAAGNRQLQFVRRAQALVAVLDGDGHANAVENAVAAPGGAHAGFHGAYGLAVGVAGLEAGVDQFAPDEGQFVHLCAEQVDALAAGDLGVEVVFLGHLPQSDELVRRDLATGHARHHGIGAVLLHVGQEVVVGVLQRCVCGLQHMAVPTGREDGRHGGFADVAAAAAAMLLDQVLERGDAFDANEVVELLAGMWKVLAEVCVDGHAELFEFPVQHLRDEGRAAAAAGAGFGVAADGAEGGCAIAYGGGNRAFRNVVAGADLHAVRQRVDGPRWHSAAFALGQDQRVRMLRQRQFVLHRLQQHAVVGGVAHQHGAEQLLAGLVHHDALVDALAFVDVGIGGGATGSAVGVADAGHVDAEQF